MFYFLPLSILAQDEKKAARAGGLFRRWRD